MVKNFVASPCPACACQAIFIATSTDTEPGVGEEDVGEPDEVDEPPTELDGGLVGEAAEHDVRHPAQLVVRRRRRAPGRRTR